jgi:hypothetical protein
MAIKCYECNGLGEIPEPHLDTTIRSKRFKLERGWRRTWLIGKLARSEGTRAALAQALGCSEGAIQHFTERHLDEILAERERVTEELSRLWIADKLNRLSEYQQDVEDINGILEEKLDRAAPAPYDPLDPANDGRATPSATDDLPVWLRAKAAIMRQVAEELGQLPQRVNVQVGGSLVTYKIEGVDMEMI